MGDLYACGMVEEILDPKVGNFLKVAQQLLIAMASKGNITHAIFGKSDSHDDFESFKMPTHRTSRSFEHGY